MIHNNTTDAPFELSGAILLYKRSSGYGSAQEAFATIHDVEQADNEAPRIGAGVPLSQKGINRVLDSLKRTKKAVILPPNILVNTDTTMAWWTKPQERMAWIKDEFEEGIGTVSGTVHYPTMIYILHNKNLFCFAVKDNERPTADTVLYHAPIMNVWETGRVCTGNVAFPKSGDISSIPKWEAALLDSYFTHPNHKAPIKGLRGGIRKLYANFLAGKYTSFPVKYLNPTGRSLGQIIGGL